MTEYFPLELLLQEITINAPLRDMLRGPAAQRKDALEYLQGKHPAAPFQPPEWLSEILNGATPEEIEQLKSAGNVCGAREVIRAIRTRLRGRFLLPQKVKRRKRGRPVDQEKLKERLAAAPGMTIKEFCEHFGIKYNTALAWRDRYGVEFKGTRRRGGRH